MIDVVDIEEPQFVGFTVEDIEQALKAVHGEDVKISDFKIEMSESLKKAFEDPRPFYIQNHGSLENALKVWREETA